MVKITEQVIDEFKKVHGDKYNYSKVEYINSKTKVCIICPIHGEFWQTPNKHINGHGCSKCAVENNTKKQTSNKEEFIEKARNIHGDKYDYSKVEYVDSKTKVCIICPTHGEFWQKPNTHLNGSGCPNCSKSKKINTKEFIEKAKKIHGDKYDYSKVNYINSTTKVCIICPIHGEFWQLPSVHLKCNCPKCSQKQFNNTQEWINEAKKVHGDKYDYSKVEYINSHTKVCIICPLHGEFWQMPYSHLNGVGCIKCCGLKRLNTETFITKAQNIHGDKYDYSKVKYVNNSTKVCIICQEHGEFWQTPKAHLNGQGCPKCRDINVAKKRAYTKEEFIEKAKNIHGDKYNYSKVKYINSKTKVCIICPIHGEFWQTPHEHLSKKGCPQCHETHLECDVRIALQNNDISYDYNNRKILNGLELDFVLKNKNVAIECQGEQHFKIKSFGSKNNEKIKSNFESQLDRDIRKYNLAKENNIQLYYLIDEKYKCFDLTNPIYGNIYNENNTFYNVDDLLKIIEVL